MTCNGSPLGGLLPHTSPCSGVYPSSGTFSGMLAAAKAPASLLGRIVLVGSVAPRPRRPGRSSFCPLARPPCWGCAFFRPSFYVSDVPAYVRRPLKYYGCVENLCHRRRL